MENYQGTVYNNSQAKCYLRSAWHTLYNFVKNKHYSLSSVNHYKLYIFLTTINFIFSVTLQRQHTFYVINFIYKAVSYMRLIGGYPCKTHTLCQGVPHVGIGCAETVNNY